MKNKKQTRKEFISDVSKVSAAVIVGGTWLGACGTSSEQSGNYSQQDEDAPLAMQQEAEEEIKKESRIDDLAGTEGCNDLSGLTEREISIREQLQYVAQSEKAEQVCKNCRFWLPAQPGDNCGGCQLIKGPIHPNGWCASWAALPPGETQNVVESS